MGAHESSFLTAYIYSKKKKKKKKQGPGSSPKQDRDSGDLKKENVGMVVLENGRNH